jgi:hypothetical protein
MGGPIHLPDVMDLLGLARPLWAVRAGTAVSSRLRKGVPNSVNLLRWPADSAPGCCRIEQRDFSAAVQAFLLAKRRQSPTQTLRRSARRLQEAESGTPHKSSRFVFS